VFLPLDLLKRILVATILGFDASDYRRYTPGQWATAWGHLLESISESSPGFCWSLSLRVGGFSSMQLNHRLLPRLLNLRELQLPEQHCQDHILYGIAKLQHLEVLVLSSTAVTAKGLGMLASGCTGKTIRALDLKGCKQVTDEAMSHLEGLPALRWMDASGTEMTADRLLSLAKTKAFSSGAGRDSGNTSLEYLSLQQLQLSCGATIALLRQVDRVVQVDRSCWRAAHKRAANNKTFPQHLLDRLLAPTHPFPPPATVMTRFEDSGNHGQAWGHCVLPLLRYGAR